MVIRRDYLPVQIKLFRVRFVEGYERFILLVVGGRDKQPVIAVFRSYEAAASFCLQLDIEVPEPPLFSKERFFKELRDLSNTDPRIAELNLFELIPHLLEIDSPKRRKA
ncbi:MAG: hypothetical protein KatS3mg101_0486 [Patescibacteria group bacterium]|nr:MAG: hypothetical protein KatS3mg101_0486 [Patescibacteria group bacterium]